MKVTVQDVQLVDREIEVEFPVYHKFVYDGKETVWTTYSKLTENGIEVSVQEQIYEAGHSGPNYDVHQSRRDLADYKWHLDDSLKSDQEALRAEFESAMERAAALIASATQP